MTETLHFTVKKLAEILQCSEKTLYNSYMEDFLKAGVVFHTKRGCPPKKVVAFFPSVVRAYFIKKSAAKYTP